MQELLLIITPIALVDSTSITPLGLVPLMSILAGPRPYPTALAFLLGLFVSYMIMGLAFLFGLGRLFEQLNAWVGHRWHHPQPVDFGVELVLGLILVIFGLRIMDTRGAKVANRHKPPQATLAAAFGLGFMMNVVGFPGALPFFAAADQIFKADPPAAATFLIMTCYALIFVTPLGILVLIRALAGARGDTLMDQTKIFFDRWGRRVLFLLLLGGGVLMIIDAGLYWLRGIPLLPV